MSIQIHSNGSQTKPHFVLVPLMAQGHMIPMIDMARLLAGRGIIITLITTPVNAARIKTIIDRIEQSGLPITFLTLRFPSVEAGLPEGVENVDLLPSRDLVRNFFDAICMLKDQLVLHFRDHHNPPPNCIISDNINYWTHDVAREFGIPRIVFHGFGCFALLCIHSIRSHKIDETMEDENEPFVVPDLPNSSIEITRAQWPGVRMVTGLDKHFSELKEAELASNGVVVNSFDELEPSYSEWYGNATSKKVWTIGPLSLAETDLADLASRGNKTSLDEDQCLKWLDSNKPSSVLYVSFGSLARPVPSQLIEIGLGLEASNSPFIWVIKAGERFSEVEGWLSKFEERTRERGLIIRGWAPQVMILTHPAVGGFMTHCGWNSTLESVSAGVPMITWPHFAEQFLNERLVVDVLKIGVAVGVKVPTTWGRTIEKDVVLVNKDDVGRAVKSLFDGEKEADERRKRVKELREKANKAVEEGGSSYVNLSHLIQHIYLNASN